MSAGNASNTVFTAIPVGEDFYMSFSTERFFHNIVPMDIQDVVFNLYDARLIGSVGSPNPNAVIETVTKSVTPNRFVITPTNVSILIFSASLDGYESTRTAGVTTTFRGELYGFASLTVAGEETGTITRLEVWPITARAYAYALQLEPDIYWDGYFYSTTVRTIAASCNAVGSLTKLS
jgi:hypothetical protein